MKNETNENNQFLASLLSTLNLTEIGRCCDVREENSFFSRDFSFFCWTSFQEKMFRSKKKLSPNLRDRFAKKKFDVIATRIDFRFTSINLETFLLFVRRFSKKFSQRFDARNFTTTIRPTLVFTSRLLTRSIEIGDRNVPSSFSSLINDLNYSKNGMIQTKFISSSIITQVFYFISIWWCSELNPHFDEIEGQEKTWF